MSKKGLSKKEWQQRLILFAQGKFVFGRGHHPRKGSYRAKELAKVETCPKHRNSVQVDPLLADKLSVLVDTTRQK